MKKSVVIGSMVALSAFVYSLFVGEQEKTDDVVEVSNNSSKEKKSKPEHSPDKSFNKQNEMAKTKAVLSKKAVQKVNDEPDVLTLADIPEGRLKKTLIDLKPQGLNNALEALESIGLTIVANDHESLNADSNGDLFYTCSLGGHGSGAHDHHHHHAVTKSDTDAHDVAGTKAVYEKFIESKFDPTGAVSINNVPAFHSRKGASKIIFLDFNGGIVKDTAWNNDAGAPDQWDCKAYSTDENYTMFSLDEQRKIHEIWMRVAEDFSSFDVDVTTEDPGSIGQNTAWALITDVKDKNEKSCPHDGAGGIAYVNTFGGRSNEYYSPAWVLPSGTSPYMASSISHEVGHNLGLNHDGTASSEYYSGHSVGGYNWTPIMGGGGSSNITQWSNGSYYGASNKQDDLAVIAGKLDYQKDNEGGNQNSAFSLLGTSVTNVEHFARIERTNDVDVYKIECADDGRLDITVDPFSIESSVFSYSGALGGNLFVSCELQNSSGHTIVSKDPELGKIVSLSPVVSAGTYYLVIKPYSTGNPANNPPDGFDMYGTVGTYAISTTFVKGGREIIPPLVLTPTKDVSYYTGSYSAANELILEQGSDGFIQFDVSSVEGPIESITLELTVGAYSGSSTTTITQSTDGNWGDNNIPYWGSSIPSAIGGALDTSSGSFSGGQVIRYDVSAADISGSTLTFIVSMTSGSGNFSFEGREEGTEFGPRLIIEKGEALPSYDTTLKLKTGYQIVSLDVVPSELDMLKLFGPILTDIDFIQAENGKKLFKNDSGVWKNEIGDWKTSQAYVVKAKRKVDLAVASTSKAIEPPVLATSGTYLVPTRITSNDTLQNHFSSIIADVEWIKDVNGHSLQKVNNQWINAIDGINEKSGFVIKVKK